MNNQIILYRKSHMQKKLVLMLQMNEEQLEIVNF